MSVIVLKNCTIVLWFQNSTKLVQIVQNARLLISAQFWKITVFDLRKLVLIKFQLAFDQFMRTLHFIGVVDQIFKPWCGKNLAFSIIFQWRNIEMNTKQLKNEKRNQVNQFHSNMGRPSVIDSRNARNFDRFKLK
ncbi:Hypothetical_protein [Hexamita inflata]|uniref:Hypothetical_protein n=1 Tax=Hexamita inflata TaxID=28002 RepID=A0AA86NJK8_9EUKA|nr:Hypothetical protein HINF_LOCUS8814 [Hexamita inflata]